MKKVLKWVIGIFVVLTILFLTAGFAAGNYFYNLAINPASDKSVVFSASHNQMSDVDVNPDEEKRKQDLEEWMEKVEFEDKYIESYDQLKLHGSMLMNETDTNRYAMLFHGYGGHGMQMTSSAKHFYELGYHVFLPDARGLGESEGDYIGMGWHERLDATRWIQMIIEQDSDAEIVLYGVSMGGATVMMIAGEDLPSNVKAIVEDCGYSSIWGEFAYQLKETFGLPTFPVMDFASIVTRIRAGYSLKEGDTIQQVAKSKTPMLFIHGDSDTFVPSFMLDEVYEAANVPKEKYVVAGAGHGEAASVDREKYWNIVENFINQYISK